MSKVVIPMDDDTKRVHVGLDSNGGYYKNGGKALLVNSAEYAAWEVYRSFHSYMGRETRFKKHDWSWEFVQDD